MPAATLFSVPSPKDRRELAQRIEAAIKRAVFEKTLEVQSTYSPPKNARGYMCEAPNCLRHAYAAGYCNAHYIRYIKGRDMSQPIRARKRADKCAECGSLTGVKGGWGLCQKHYRRVRGRLVKKAIVAEMGGACKQCRQSYDPAVYDFHHVGAKDFSPSKLVKDASPAEIGKELSLCVLLCANCHRIEHFAEGKYDDTL